MYIFWQLQPTVLKKVDEVDKCQCRWNTVALPVPPQSRRHMPQHWLRGGGGMCRKLAGRYLSVRSPALHSFYAFFISSHFLSTVLVVSHLQWAMIKCWSFLKREERCPDYWVDNNQLYLLPDLKTLTVRVRCTSSVHVVVYLRLTQFLYHNFDVITA
jgi:hypothetical protein